MSDSKLLRASVFFAGCMNLFAMFGGITHFVYEKLRNDKDGNKEQSQTVHSINKHKRKPVLPKELSEPPLVAIPTFIGAFILLIFWIIIQCLHYFEYLSLIICFPIFMIIDYCAFHLMHEASHFAVASKRGSYNWLNPLVGRIGGFIMSLQYPIFVFNHLRHHKYTNNPNMDPDFWSNHGVWYILPFKWCSQMHYYLYYWFKNLHCHSISDIVEVMIWIIGCYYIQNKYEIDIFSTWLLPTLCCGPFIAIIFDYIPHRGNKNVDIFVGSYITSLYGDTNYYEQQKKEKQDVYKIISPLTIPFICHNYHGVHHIYPWIPVYRYSKVWYKLDEQLISKGTKIRSILPIF